MFKEISKILDKEQNYLTEYIISDYEDIFNIKKITFYYVLLRYILKSNYYIYHCPFLLETRKTILKLIRNNLEQLQPSIKKNKDFKDKIEYVLKSFISYDWYYNQSIKKINEMKSNPNSLVSSNKSNLFDNQSGSNLNNQGYNNNFSVSSSPGYFSNPSYKKEKDENSGRNFDNYEEPIILVYDDLKAKYRDDICFKILQKSTFILNVNKKDNKVTFEFGKIKINNDMQIEYDIAMNSTSKTKIVNDNYNKFKQFLNNIKKLLEENCSNNFSFKVTLNFQTKTVQKSEFNIKCLYYLEIPGEDNNEFRDENILFIDDLSTSEGFGYLLNDIKERNN